MNITVIGTGYVGLVSGTCFSEFGFDVTCVDKDATKVAKLEQNIMPIYEPGLETLVKKNVSAGRLSFTTDITVTKDADIIFIAVGTPSREDGHADMRYVFGALDDIAPHLKENSVIVTKSTVPVGTGAKVKAHLNKARPDLTLHVASNPEFLREGAAIEDFMRPNRIVIGVESKKAEATLKELYRPLYLNKSPLVVTTIESAELIKYAANGFLATKIAFINEIADLCEQCGADVQEVAYGIGLDNRIGSKFLHTGPGFGGSCFPKDTRALHNTGKEHNTHLSIIDAVISSNEKRKHAMAKRIQEVLGQDLSNKCIAVLGLTFKPNTDDMRESASLDILPILLDAGATLQVYDPEGMEEAKKLLPAGAKIQWARGAYDALNKADAGIILTEWNEFRALDSEKMRATMKKPVLFDFRNIYNLDEMHQAGFHYYSLGRQVINQLDVKEIQAA